ncbi:hypothetical protein AKJ16_DCAP14616 [Drosera capensis]
MRINDIKFGLLETKLQTRVTTVTGYRLGLQYGMQTRVMIETVCRPRVDYSRGDCQVDCQHEERDGEGHEWNARNSALSAKIKL